MTHEFLKTKEEISAWLDKYQVENYTLVPNEQYGYVIDVGFVGLAHKNLEHIPVKFNHVRGNFFCHNNKLTSLEFSPEYVYGDFGCPDNQIISLKYAPKTVGGVFNLSDNKLTTLQYCPKEVGGDFYCNKNQLVSLEGCPQILSGRFDCSENQLKTLKHCPKETGGYFDCSDNQLMSLEYCPQKVGSGFYCSNNDLLGQTQEIYDFQEIYKIHKVFANIKKEKELLVEHIIANKPQNNKNDIARFKI